MIKNIKYKYLLDLNMLVKISEIIVHIALFIISQKRLLRKYKISSYNIVKKPNLIDFRQEFWFKSINNKNCLVYIHSINPFFCLINFFKNKNFIFPESIFFMNKIYNKNVSLYDILLKINKKQKIKKHYSIDDPRNIKIYADFCMSNSIELYLFMHARFNKTHKQIFSIKFNKYFVWSDHFKSLYLKYSKVNLQNNIEVIGHPFLKLNTNIVKKKSINKVLLIEEDLISNDLYMQIIEILNNFNYDIYFKLKPGAYVNRNNLKNIVNLIDTNNIFNCILDNDISLVIGFYSTALFESYLINVPSIVIKNRTQYFEDFILSEHPYICSKADLPKVLKSNDFSNKINKKIIQNYSEKIWGQNIFINDFLNKFAKTHVEYNL